MTLFRAICTGLVVALSSLASLSQGSEHDASSNRPVHERWIPAFTASVMIHDWTADGGVLNAGLYSTRGTSSEQVAVFQLGVELSSPQLEFLPAGPRLFAFGGGRVNPIQNKIFASSGEFKAREPESKVEQSNDAGTSLPLPLFPGQGSEVAATYLNGGWYAGVGISLAIPDRESRVRLKGTLNYVGERVEAFGKLAMVARPEGEPYQVIRKTTSGQSTFHHFGPGLEAEMVISPGSDLAVSVYGGVQFLWAPGNRSIDLPGAGGAPKFTYTLENFGVRGGFGLRIAWLSAFGSG